MSRIGKLPIEVSKDVKLKLDNSVLVVQGPLGKLSRRIMQNITLNISDNAVTVICNDTATSARSAHGLTRTLIYNMVTGVTKGFQKSLEINGVGYRAEVKGKQLLLNLGFSHQISYDIPDGISVEVDKMTRLLVKGYDKELVGQTSAKIRSFRPPEPYKGKGIKYADETILRKAGKTGKK